MARSSSQPTRDERLERQQRDPGDPEDTVYYRQGATSAIYHDERDCQRLKQIPEDEIGSDPRRVEQRRWHGPCLWCVLGDPSCSP